MYRQQTLSKKSTKKKQTLSDINRNFSSAGAEGTRKQSHIGQGGMGRERGKAAAAPQFAGPLWMNQGPKTRTGSGCSESPPLLWESERLPPPPHHPLEFGQAGLAHQPAAEPLGRWAAAAARPTLLRQAVPSIKRRSRARNRAPSRKALGSVSQGAGFEPGLSPTHVFVAGPPTSS